MKKQKWLRITNPILLLLLLCQVGSGLFRGSIGYEIFGKVHLASGLLLLGFGVLHLILNWGWVKLNYLSRR